MAENPPGPDPLVTPVLANLQGFVVAHVCETAGCGYNLRFYRVTSDGADPAGSARYQARCGFCNVQQGALVTPVVAV